MEDKEILTKIREKEYRETGFSLLVKKYQQRIYWHIRKMVIDHDDADDILQEVFIKVWKGIDKFREDSSLYTWIYRIATHESLNYLNRKRRRSMFSLDDVNQELSRKLDQSSHIDGTEIQMKLQKALLKLPDKQRLVFNMKYFDDMKYEEISAITDTSVGGLKASYHHAVKKIEEYLTRD
ncbi:MAG: sigma-70 family RNA polymerase sigma factor [Cyclobacteriaceae bacterium]|nr:sigma-70 family RNA polymerase sigma factor [Cyclobacteriaceae bacterium]